MSHEHIPFDPELSAIESALGSLTLARSRINRDLIMFRAGQAAAQRRSSSRRAWIMCAASFGLLALVEAFLLAHRPPPQIVERIVVEREPATSQVESSPERALADGNVPSPSSFSERPLAFGSTAYARLEEQVIRYGLDGLPAREATARADFEPAPAASRQLLQEELRRILDPGDHS